MGQGGSFLIGPPNERWDAVLLIRQSSVEKFLAFESNIDYMKGIGHRTAALEDSRLLPIAQVQGHAVNMPDSHELFDLLFVRICRIFVLSTDFDEVIFVQS